MPETPSWWNTEAWGPFPEKIAPYDMGKFLELQRKIGEGVIKMIEEDPES